MYQLNLYQFEVVFIPVVILKLMQQTFIESPLCVRCSKHLANKLKKERACPCYSLVKVTDKYKQVLSVITVVLQSALETA